MRWTWLLPGLLLGCFERPVVRFEASQLRAPVDAVAVIRAGKLQGGIDLAVLPPGARIVHPTVSSENGRSEDTSRDEVVVDAPDVDVGHFDFGPLPDWASVESHLGAIAKAKGANTVVVFKVERVDHQLWGQAEALWLDHGAKQPAAEDLRAAGERALADFARDGKAFLISLASPKQTVTWSGQRGKCYAFDLALKPGARFATGTHQFQFSSGAFVPRSDTRLFPSPSEDWSLVREYHAEVICPLVDGPVSLIYFGIGGTGAGEAEVQVYSRAVDEPFLVQRQRDRVAAVEKTCRGCAPHLDECLGPSIERCEPFLRCIERSAWAIRATECGAMPRR